MSTQFYPNPETCSCCGERAEGVHRCDTVHVMDHQKQKAVQEVAEWLRSADAGALYGSESWALRRRIAEALERGTHKSWRSRVDSR